MDTKNTIPLDRCPAEECPPGHNLSRITEQHLPDLYEQLEKVASGKSYDYYHCQWGCRRLWRIQKFDRLLGEPYCPPEQIGFWDDEAQDAPVIYESALWTQIRWEYQRSRSEPSQPAQSKHDAQQS